MTTTTFDPERQLAFVGRMFGAADGALELLTFTRPQSVNGVGAIVESRPAVHARLAMSEQPSAGRGAIVREDALRALAEQAGLSFAPAPIEHEMVRFFTLAAA